MTRFKYKLVLLCCLLLLGPTLEANGNTVATTCSVPTVRRGEPATITCDFMKDVRQLAPVSITVERYPFTEGSREVQILSCQLMTKDEKPSCAPREAGYTLKGEIDRILQLKIESASEEFTGRYACKMMSKDENPEPEICFFKVLGQEPNATEEGTTVSNSTAEEGSKILAIVLPVVLAIAAVVIAVVVVVVCLIRRNRNRTNKSITEPCIAPEDKKSTKSGDSPGVRDELGPDEWRSNLKEVSKPDRMKADIELAKAQAGGAVLTTPEKAEGPPDRSTPGTENDESHTLGESKNHTKAAVDFQNKEGDEAEERDPLIRQEDGGETDTATNQRTDDIGVGSEGTGEQMSDSEGVEEDVQDSSR